VNKSYKPDKFGEKNARNFDEDVRSLTVMQELESAILEMVRFLPFLPLPYSYSPAVYGLGCSAVSAISSLSRFLLVT
jgi:hypothetical protein